MEIQSTASSKGGLSSVTLTYFLELELEIEIELVGLGLNISCDTPTRRGVTWTHTAVGIN